MTDAHARLSPSNHRWVHCPGSIREEERYPDIAGAAAIDGTGSHELLELCLKNAVPAAAYVGQTIGVGHADMPMGWVVDEARAGRVQMCLDYVARRHRELTEQYPGCQVLIFSESRSNPGSHCAEPREDWWGTVDITISVEDAHGCQVFLEVCDYKDGRGWVSEEDNPQLQSYWIGKAFESIQALGWKSRHSIVQPKTSKPIRYTQDLEPRHLTEVFRKLSAAAAATDDPDAPLRAGEWCLWCKASPKRGGHCTRAAEQSVQEIQNMSELQTDGELSGLLTLNVNEATPEQLAAIMDQEPILQAAFDRVRKEIESRVEQGLPVPGWALVPGRGSRSWADKEEAEKALKRVRLKIDEHSPRTLISPAQAEELLGPERFQKIADQVVETVGKPKVSRVAVREEKSADALFVDVPKVEVVKQDTAAAAPSFL